MSDFKDKRQKTRNEKLTSRKFKPKLKDGTWKLWGKACPILVQAEEANSAYFEHDERGS